MTMHRADLATHSGVHSKPPDAAAPHRTPQIRGTHVTGLVSWSRIFHSDSVVSAAPFMPSSWRAAPDWGGWVGGWVWVGEGVGFGGGAGAGTRHPPFAP